MNATMFAVQDIYDHVAKYTIIPANWHSKNYAFEFEECINDVVKNYKINDLSNAKFCALVVEESADTSVTKMLMLTLYIKFRLRDDIVGNCWQDGVCCHAHPNCV
jgi:hypothetical protein